MRLPRLIGQNLHQTPLHLHRDRRGMGGSHSFLSLDPPSLPSVPKKEIQKSHAFGIHDILAHASGFSDGAKRIRPDSFLLGSLRVAPRCPARHLPSGHPGNPRRGLELCLLRRFALQCPERRDRHRLVLLILWGAPLFLRKKPLKKRDSKTTQMPGSYSEEPIKVCFCVSSNIQRTNL